FNPEYLCNSGPITCRRSRRPVWCEAFNGLAVAMSLACLLPLIPDLVGSAVSKPYRLESTARGPAIAKSCAIGGKGNVRRSSSSRGGQHLANRHIVCRSVLLEVQNR